MSKDVLTVAEIAQAYRISLKSVYRWLRSKELPARKSGRAWQVSRTDLEAFLKTGPGGGPILVPWPCPVCGGQLRADSISWLAGKDNGELLLVCVANSEHQQARHLAKEQHMQAYVGDLSFLGVERATGGNLPGTPLNYRGKDNRYCTACGTTLTDGQGTCPNDHPPGAVGHRVSFRPIMNGRREQLPVEG